MAIIDVVRFDGLRNRDWLVYKFPSDELVYGTRLIVQQGQVAILVRGGAIADMFSPGAYTLTSENLPILKALVNLPYGGRTPFSVEVYFINTLVKLDVHWGTSDPIQLIDPKYHIKLRVRAFGQMGMRIVDAKEFFSQLVGAIPFGDLVKIDKINEYYRGILVIKVKAAIAEAIIEAKISALDISTQLEAISAKVKEQISSSFLTYGMTVVNFFIESINFPDEDFAQINKLLEDRAAFEIMGEERYLTKRALDVYEGAANNKGGTAGAFVAGGLGLGAALNLSAAMQKRVGNPLDPGKSAFCTTCGAKLPPKAKFCAECGTKVVAVSAICECGAKLSKTAKFCPECGKKVGGETNEPGQGEPT